MNCEYRHSPFTDADQIAFSAVLQLVTNDTSLTSQRRRDLCSSVRSLGKWFGRDLDSLPASRSCLRALFRDFHPQHVGISQKRVQNVQSDLNFVLDTFVPGSKRATHLAEMTPEWKALWNRLPGKYPRTALARLMRYCSAQGISPDEVSDDVSQRFLAALEEENLTKKPRTAHQTACRVWNRMRQEVDGWPRYALSVPRYRETYGLPWSAFPRSFREEADAYVDALSGRDLLADSAPLKPVKPRTAETRRDQIQRFASALVQRGHAPEAITDLRYLVDIDNFKEGLRFFLDRNGNRTSGFIGDMAYALRTIGLKWVKVDKAHEHELQRIYRRLAVADQGLTEKNRTCLRQFDDEQSVSWLISYPVNVIETVERKSHWTRTDALSVQIAVAVLILIHAPMRLHNLASLNLARHARWRTQGKNRILSLSIPRHEVKNEENLEYELPHPVATFIQVYIDRYRPLISPNPGPWLFPGRTGSHKRPDSLGKQIHRQVWQRTGLRLTPHQFRHAMAKIYLDRRPGEYEVVRRVLGHRSAETTYRYYAGAETKAAVQRFDDVILGLGVNSSSHRHASPS